MIVHSLLLSVLLCLPSQIQGQEAPEAAKASSKPYIVLGLVPPAADNSTQDNLLPHGRLFNVLLKGSAENQRVARSASPDHDHQHTPEQHDHSGHDHTGHDHTHDHSGDPKKREKRGYCSKCGGQLGYGGGGLGGYGGGGYGGGGYGGGCGGNCGGGRPIYQQPIYQQPIYQRPSYGGGGGGVCSVCGQPYGGGGYGGGGGQSYSSSQSSSSSSSGSYGKK